MAPKAKLGSRMSRNMDVTLILRSHIHASSCPGCRDAGVLGCCCFTLLPNIPSDPEVVGLHDIVGVELSFCLMDRTIILSMAHNLGK